MNDTIFKICPKCTNNSFNHSRKRFQDNFVLCTFFKGALVFFLFVRSRFERDHRVNLIARNSKTEFIPLDLDS